MFLGATFEKALKKLQFGFESNFAQIDNRALLFFSGSVRNNNQLYFVYAVVKGGGQYFFSLYNTNAVIGSKLS